MKTITNSTTTKVVSVTAAAFLVCVFLFFANVANATPPEGGGTPPVVGITLSPSSGSATYNQGELLTPSTVTLNGGSGDENGLLTYLSLKDGSNDSILFDSVFSSFALSTGSDGPYDLVAANPHASILVYGPQPDGYGVTSGSSQVTTLTGSIKTDAPVGVYTLITEIKKGSEVKATATYTLTIKDPTVATIGEIKFLTIQDALNAAVDGDSINIIAGEHLVSSILSINKKISLVGQGGGVIIKSDNASWSTSNESKHLVDIFTTGVTLSNLTLDSNDQSFGVQFYKAAGQLNNVTIKNSKGAGLTINGSTVSATNLNTQNNDWGAVNVDPGVRVEVPSVFTLIGGILAEKTQIWFDGANVNATSTVEVNANNYKKYHPAWESSANFFIWTDRPLMDVAVITKIGISTIYPTVQAAVVAAEAGDTIHLFGTAVITDTIALNKPVTIDGQGSAIIKTSGNKSLFVITATSTTVKNLVITKTDKVTVNDPAGGIIWIHANDVSILNNIISGQYVFGDNEVSRAIVTSGGHSGIMISGNEIYDLRQPAYISGLITGTVSNNYVYRTKGWVIEQGNLEFTENTWGTGTNANVYDIAILATASSSYYSDVLTMAAANNGAFIEDQRTTPATLSRVYVDGNTIYIGGNSNDGTARSPKKTIAEGIARVIPGGTIFLASDIIAPSEITINKPLTIDGNNHTITASFIGSSVIGVHANSVIIKNLIEDGGGLVSNNRGINVYKVINVLLDNVTAKNNAKNGIVVNGSTVTVNNIETSGNGWEGIDVDMGSGVTTLASITINGTSVHNGSKAAIRIDDLSKTPTPKVIDTNSQYSLTSVTTTTTDYYLKTKNVKTNAGSTQTITIEGIVFTVEIPSDAIVSGNSAWDGTILPPTATTTVLTISGQNTSVAAAVVVGSTDYDLSFSAPVKLIFAGQAGKLARWYNHAGIFEQIPACPVGTSKTVAPTLGADEDCVVDDGSDLVIWTRHLSTFVVFTATPIPPPVGSTGGGGGWVASVPTDTSSQTTSTTTATTTPVGQVLGAATFNFANNLKLGMEGDEVAELQKRLTQEGVYSGPITGYFGNLTLAGVKAYQAKVDVPQTGFVGVLTRAQLNSSQVAGVSTDPQTQINTIIQQLSKLLEGSPADQAQIATLIQRLTELTQE